MVRSIASPPTPLLSPPHGARSPLGAPRRPSPASLIVLSTIFMFVESSLARAAPLVFPAAAAPGEDPIVTQDPVPSYDYHNIEGTLYQDSVPPGEDREEDDHYHGVKGVPSLVDSVPYASARTPIQSERLKIIRALGRIPC